MESVTPEREPITYRLALGEDWYRIRLDEHAEADVKAFLDVMFDAIPADAAEGIRALIGVQFAVQIAAARSRRGIELLVPSPKPGGAALPGVAVLVAEVVIPTPVAPDPVEVAARVARGAASTRTGVIAGSVAVRIDHSAADAEEDEDDGANAGPVVPTRQRIEYVIAVPNDPRWLSIDLIVQAVAGFDVEQTITDFDQAVGQLGWSASE
ncbi:hypothetical protein [Catenulispora pinisilvae]|uniref:hypothetical protein n=1 Tax=Catenulispora pinisilvae TaxID=2705253 RepID=UPI0018926B40|nr:hypothetical protein [Catenulispora pinisilvae]